MRLFAQAATVICLAPSSEMPAAAESRLPPGPRLPRIVQTLGFMFGGRRYLEACRRRYGGAVTMGTVFDSRFVMIFDPDLVKQVFQGSNDRLHAGEANALLGPLLGQRSVLVLDGEEHLRQRRLLLPPFHGQRMRAYERVMLDAADREIDSWPVDVPFAVLPSMQALTLAVVMRAVFGFDPGPAETELRARLRAMIEPITHRRSGMVAFALTQGRANPERGAFARRRAAVDEILFAEIARRRADPDLSAREDVFSALLVAHDEEGAQLSDREVRDELLTLLVAGHETTATALAWTLDLILHTPRVLALAKQADDAYLDAVVKESLRMRPIIPAVGRVVRGEPFPLGEYLIPDGVELNPAIRIIHRRADLYPQPGAFRPERFLGPEAGGRVGGVPDTYTWLPFGGGTRRCLGASFALMELRVVLRRILQRTELRAAARRHDKAELRAITLAPRDGVRVILTERPRPAAAQAADAQTAAAAAPV